MVDMIVRLGDRLINIGEIAFIEKSFEEVNKDYKHVRFIFKSGKEEIINITNKEYENLMEYYSSLCPDLNDDYTRKMMVQHIMNQRTQMVQQMMSEGKIPRTDFPDQMGGGGGRLVPGNSEGRGPAIR